MDHVQFIKLLNRAHDDLENIPRHVMECTEWVHQYEAIFVAQNQDDQDIIPDWAYTGSNSLGFYALSERGRDAFMLYTSMKRVIENRNRFKAIENIERYARQAKQIVLLMGDLNLRDSSITTRDFIKKQKQDLTYRMLILGIMEAFKNDLFKPFKLEDDIFSLTEHGEGLFDFMDKNVFTPKQ